MSKASDFLVHKFSFLKTWSKTKQQAFHERRKAAADAKAAAAPADPINSPSGSHGSDFAYRDRLAKIYEAFREHDANIDYVTDPLAKPHLLSPLPEWTEKFITKEEGPDKGKITRGTMEAVPRLQAALASATTYTPSKWLLEQELALRDSRAAGRKSWNPAGTQDVYDAAAFENLAGLAFSGGGIRSATFCLGILQGLAKSNLLDKFDYLSTVSGGGYIHQWFASWIHRDKEGFKSVEKQLIPVPNDNSKVRSPEQIRWLRRYSSYLTPQTGIFSVDTWTMIAIWTRNTFLNQIVLFGFLASCLLAIRGITYPFRTHFKITANSKTPPPAAAWVWLSSFVHRWDWLSSKIAQLHGLATNWKPLHDQQWALLLLFISFVASVRFGFALHSLTASRKKVRTFFIGALTSRGVFFWLVIPGFLNSLLLVLSLMGKISLGRPWYGIELILVCWGAYVLFLLLAVTIGGHAPWTFKDLRGTGRGWALLSAVPFLLSAIACAALSFGAVYAFCNPAKDSTTARLTVNAQSVAAFIDKHLGHDAPSIKLHQELTNDGEKVSTLDINLTAGQTYPPADQSHTERLLIIFAPVIFFYLQFLAIRLHLGVLGRFYTESRREWLARLGAWAAMVSGVWILLGLIGLTGPVIFNWFFNKETFKWLPGMISVIAAHAATLYAGGSGKTDGKPKPGALFGYSMLDLLGMIGAPICILSLLIIVSGLVSKLINWSVQPGSPWWLPIASALTVFLTFLFFGWRVDVNAFSLHAFYRDRLARCYIGASNPRRNPDPFSGFDDHSETGTAGAIGGGTNLADFLPECFHTAQEKADKAEEARKAKKKEKIYDGPFPIFCSTLNLTFGEDLAWQERKGASFAFTPLYSGYHVGWTAETRSHFADTTFNGYVPTGMYAYSASKAGGNGGIGLSTVAAVSGAALSPNQGFSTQPALAFLMTLFNIRLGWWLANPRKPNVWPASKNIPTPIFGLRYLLSELFGQADDTSNYVCLADGGRFEDMGMYELVRRRCRLIVVCDGELEDGTYDGIGKAIAKCRTDFDVEITLNLFPLIPNPVSGHSAQHFQFGTIRYPAPPGGDPKDPKYTGNIVYLKTTIVGDEPADILHHKLAHPEFPQDSTANQWFNESRFESYRRLGELIGTQAAVEISDCAAAIGANAAKSGPVSTSPIPIPVKLYP